MDFWLIFWAIACPIALMLAYIIVGIATWNKTTGSGTGSFPEKEKWYDNPPTPSNDYTYNYMPKDQPKDDHLIEKIALFEYMEHTWKD